MRRKIIWVGIVAAIALAIITAVSMNSLGGSSVPVLDAVKINAELQHLYNLKHDKWCWEKLLHKQVGKIVIDDRVYPVYHDKGERIVYMCVRDESQKAAFNNDQSQIRQQLDQHAQRLGIKVTQNYSSTGNQEFVAAIEAKPSPYDARIEELDRQFDLAIRQVKHKPLKSNGRMHKILSDPSGQYFVVISPWDAMRPKRSELEARVTKIAAAKGTHYSMIVHEQEPPPPLWVQKIKRLLRI